MVDCAVPAGVGVTFEGSNATVTLECSPETPSRRLLLNAPIEVATVAVDEAKVPVENGFDYVTEVDEFKLFRKRK
jgi:hypothetical protein